MKLIYKKIICLTLLFIASYGYSQNDCINALIACGDSNYSDLSVSGPGINEINGLSCYGEENNSLWIKITIQNSGTLGFKIIPTSTNINIDFDFWVFGPNSSCTNLGNSIRCSTTNPEMAGSHSNVTGMASYENDTFEGPGSLGNNFVSFINALAGETYFLVIDRWSGDSNFSLQWTGTATFDQAPTVNNSVNGATLNIDQCDSDGISDGISEFNLLPNKSLAIGTQNNVVATFHTNVNDAILGINSILNTSNYANVSNPQTLYIRLENTLTGCYSTANFDLNVIPLPTPDPINIESCDNDKNGFTQFNLQINDPILTNGSTNLVVTYHPTNNDTVTLPTNYTNQVAYTNEIIWAKIKDVNDNCFIYKSFELIINNPPISFDSQLTQCDFEVFPDGLTTFNLQEANNAITNNDTTLQCTYYLNSVDAGLQSNPIPTVYNNISNPQILYVRVTNATTGCFSVVELTLNVNINPTQVVALQKCDYDGIEDGITTFNLADAGYQTVGNTVNYYTTVNDALLEQNHIIATTGTFNTQTIYARIENGNDCVGLNIINIIVDPLPKIDLNLDGDDDVIVCANLPGNIITLTADLTDTTPTSNYTYQWYLDSVAIPGATNYTLNINTPGTYTVDVTNGVGCLQTRTILGIPSDIAAIETIQINDLSDNNSVIINVVSGTGGNYVYSLDAEFGPFQTSNLFENVSYGFHIVYIKDINGCGTTKKIISVLGIPKFFTPNGDSTNDTWNIRGVSKDFYPNTIIHIYDRYGKILAQISPLGAGWDGTYNGNLALSDDYWYYIKVDDGRVAIGHFSLKR